MRQLSGIDVSFLNMETSSVFGHVSSLNIYDPEGAPGGGGLDATRQILLERMDALAPFRRRLVEVPLGLDNPYWIEDPAFDIDFHVRHHAVPPPGSPEQLAEVVSRIIARPLDRSRPLWELYVIEGVDGGRRIAQLTKVHHATIDGASGAKMLAAILDPDPHYRPEQATLEPWTPERVPSDPELIRRTMVELFRRPEKVVRLTVRAARELAASSRSGGLQALAGLIAQPMPGRLGDEMRRRRVRLRGNETDRAPALPTTAAPRTPWNAPVTPHRRFAYTTVSLEDAKTIRRAGGCTFNDVVMALCSGALRRYLLAHDCLPAEPLIAMVPVSVRSGDETDIYQNRVSALMADLATNEPDPLKRLARVQQSMTAAKADFKAIPAETLQDYTQFAPPAVAARAMRMYSRLRIADRMNPPFNLIISNVPGPSTPLYSAGARLEHFYPVSAVADGQGLNMTVQSYNGNLDFGFVACRELVPDLWTMADHLQAAMRELLDAVEAVEGAGTTEAAAPAAAAEPTATKRAASAPAVRTKAATRTAATKRSGTPTTKAASKRAPATKQSAPTDAPAMKRPAAREAPVAKQAAAKKAPAAKRAAAKKAPAAKQAPAATKVPARPRVKRASGTRTAAARTTPPSSSRAATQP
ncbi:MAG: wax ester synthase/diacylglycerol acyltransferase [Ilumatobacteraceae bacterium]|nr:wax ester synthase/diacylglycerol acyltransferase [Ilumatobacteraceae bacterium]